MDYYDFQHDTIGRVLYNNHEKFPQLFAAMFYLTAQNCYFTEMHPSGVENHMVYYIAKEPYRLRSIVDYYLVSRKYVLTFIDECEYYKEESERYYGIYEPSSNYDIKKVLEVIHNYEIKLKKIEFYGIEIKELPEVIESFKNTEIHLINCPPLPKKENYSNLKIREITEDRFALD